MQNKKQIVADYLSNKDNSKKQTKDQLVELAEMGCAIERTIFLKYKRQLKGHTEVTPEKVTVGHTEVTPSFTFFNVFKWLSTKPTAAQVFFGLFQPLMRELDETNNTDQMDETIDLLDQLNSDDYFKRCGFNFDKQFWNIYDMNKKYYKNLVKHWN